MAYRLSLQHAGATGLTQDHAASRQSALSALLGMGLYLGVVKTAKVVQQLALHHTAAILQPSGTDNEQTGLWILPERCCTAACFRAGANWQILAEIGRQA